MADTTTDGRATSGPEPGIDVDRRPDYHPVRWLSLTGSRRAITLLLTGFILASLLAVGTLWELEMETLVRDTRAVQSLLNTLLGGIILFVSVVLSINTAALSQEFAPLRTKHAQIEESIQLQADLERFVSSGISPADVHGFVAFVLEVLRSEVADLRERADSLEDRTAGRDVVAFVEDVESKVAVVEGRLHPGDRRMAATLLAALDWNPVHHLYLARRLRAEHGDSLGTEDAETFSNLVEILTAFASGREYFTTLYFKRELRRLSADLLVLSLPVIVFTAYVLLAIDAGLFPTVTAFGIQPRLLYVSVSLVVAVSPYVLLSAYMLRIVTVWKHSLDSGGFTTSEGGTTDAKGRP